MRVEVPLGLYPPKRGDGNAARTKLPGQAEEHHHTPLERQDVRRHLGDLVELREPQLEVDHAHVPRHAQLVHIFHAVEADEH
eukprot:3760213-Prymnesium_polylepis.1